MWHVASCGFDTTSRVLWRPSHVLELGRLSFGNFITLTNHTILYPQDSSFWKCFQSCILLNVPTRGSAAILCPSVAFHTQPKPSSHINPTVISVEGVKRNSTQGGLCWRDSAIDIYVSYGFWDSQTQWRVSRVLDRQMKLQTKEQRMQFILSNMGLTDSKRHSTCTIAILYPQVIETLSNLEGI